MRPPRLVVVIAALALLAGGITSCSLKRLAVKSVANSLTSGPDVYSRDDDPELIRDAIPFGLKTLESLLEVLPDHEGLLLSLCRGYTQYAYAFVQMDADEIEPTDYAKATEMRERALKLFLRARDYGLRGLERRHKGISKRLWAVPDSAVAQLRKDELPMLYWTAAAWGSAINLGKDRADLVADFPVVKKLMDRGLVLDEGYDGGALHEAAIVLEALPAVMGGSPDRAREHFRRAVELGKGMRAGPYVTLASSVSVMSQNRAEFRSLLNQALAVDTNRDPNQRLANTVLQRKARALLLREDDLFLAPDTTQTEEKK
jgi:hypothetical protein